VVYEETLELQRELDHRSAGGIEVALLWSRRTNRLWVAVDDGLCDRSFTFDVDGSNALDAFHHPYAYAAQAGVAGAEPPCLSPTA
jgi:hypothetical protein